MIRRNLTSVLTEQISRGKSVLLLGPRQVGKTTLLSSFVAALRINLATPHERLRYERLPALLAQEIASLSQPCPLIILDEIQKVPELLNLAQGIIDQKQAQFIFTGSSARKLYRMHSVNLLPGRIVKLVLDPLDLCELQDFIQPTKPDLLLQLILDGSLPSIFLTFKRDNRALDLKSYVETYLEEEIRAEAVVRNLGVFSRFLELAGLEAGQIINYSKIANELGINKNTVASYFEILFDCLLAERIEPITHSKTRKKLTKSNRFLFFDMGVRRACAHEGWENHPDRLGQFFEQWVGLELIRMMRMKMPFAQLRFWRDPDGPEVDWVVENEGKYYPIEVKWSESPGMSDAKHIHTFHNEYPNAQDGYVICRTPRKFKISNRVTALPWQELAQLFSKDGSNLNP